MGCAAAVHGSVVKRGHVAWLRALCVLSWGLAAVAIVLGGHSTYQRYQPYFGTLIGIATALMLLLMLREVSDGRPSLPTRLVSWGPLVRIGLFSYSLYLIHAPMLHLADRIFTMMVAPVPELMFVLLVAASPLIVGAAYVFHVAFERPFVTTTSVPKSRDPWSARAPA
jgi:peptidoglycan/LPS O-acetylase OafA/YrhL